MALHLIMKNREGAVGLAHALNEATSYIHECSLCHSLTENEVCDICVSHERDDQLLCVVESPADVMAIEQSGECRTLALSGREVAQGHIEQGLEPHPAQRFGGVATAVHLLPKSQRLLQGEFRIEAGPLVEKADCA